jgi:uncharacterized membrane protein YbhN (UPF0104 family)
LLDCLFAPECGFRRRRRRLSQRHLQNGDLRLKLPRQRGILVRLFAELASLGGVLVRLFAELPSLGGVLVGLFAELPSLGGVLV